MAGLNDINPNDPAGTETPTFGDNRIRALAAKIIEAFGIEHALAGAHTFPKGTAAQRPAVGHAGRFFILTIAGVAVELQYDTGSAWVNITSNQAVIGQTEDIAAHIAADPIDHPNDSVTAAKILAGNILAKHLDAASGNASIAALVDGSNADTFHVHASTDQNIAKFTSSAWWTCPAGVTLVEFQGWAGGGGGSGFETSYRSGGGGGGYIASTISVVPGTGYEIIVGAGGTGGTSGGGGVGGTTSMSGKLAYGGAGGASPGGTGGSWSTGRGCLGEQGTYPDITGSGGQGGGFGGVGGVNNGETGSTPGGGGGGFGGIGGNGARGFATLKW